MEAKFKEILENVERVKKWHRTLKNGRIKFPQIQLACLLDINRVLGSIDAVIKDHKGKTLTQLKKASSDLEKINTKLNDVIFESIA